MRRVNLTVHAYNNEATGVCMWNMSGIQFNLTPKYARQMMIDFIWLKRSIPATPERLSEHVNGEGRRVFPQSKPCNFIRQTVESFQLNRANQTVFSRTLQLHYKVRLLSLISHNMLFVCLSVCLSVCRLSRECIVTRWLKLGSRGFHTKVA